jgi:outer membrane biosynthesis protein TonB
MAFPRKPGTTLFLKMVGVSFVIHIASVVFFNLNPWPTIIKVRPTAYTVTLMPVSISEPEIPKTPVPPVPREEKIKPIEKVKPIEKPKKDDIIEKVKQPEKKTEKPTEEKKESTKRIQEALDEIRKKAALDEIKKRVARSEREVERPTAITSVKTSPGMESKLNEYYSLLWAKIKGAWTIPENLLKEKEWVDLEAIIVIIIERNGKIQKWWFEKKSGNALYDQSAIRAIKKAEPLPSVPKELSEDTLEIGIRFFPD